LQLQRDLIVAYSQCWTRDWYWYGKESQPFRILGHPSGDDWTRQTDRLFFGTWRVWTQSDTEISHIIHDAARFHVFQGPSFKRNLILCCMHTHWPAPSRRRTRVLPCFPTRNEEHVEHLHTSTLYTLHICCRWRSGLKSQCSSRAKRLRFMSWLTEVSALSMWHLYTCNTMQYINQWETRRHDVYEYIWVYVIGVCKEVTTCRHTHTMPSNGMPCRAMSCHAMPKQIGSKKCRADRPTVWEGQNAIRVPTPKHGCQQWLVAREDNRSQRFVPALLLDVLRRGFLESGFAKDSSHWFARILFG